MKTCLPSGSLGSTLGGFEDPHAFVEFIEGLLDEPPASVVLDVPRGRFDRDAQ